MSSLPDEYVESQQITHLLRSWREGDEQALASLMPMVYQRLKVIAAYLMRQESRGSTLETTSLVHEAYLRLIDINSVRWQDRSHFFSMCARIMRRVLVEQARYNSRAKRGSQAQRVDIVEVAGLAAKRAPDLLALDESLAELAKHDTEKAKVVELRFFGGLDRDAIAEVMGLSSATVTRRWRAARAWLLQDLKFDQETEIPR